MIGRWRRAAPRPQMPAGERLYAVGDVHGRLDLLTQLIRRIEAEEQDLPPARTAILLLGDIIDRGPQSRQVIELVMRSRGGLDPVVLKGNHEEIVAAAWLGDDEALEGWLAHGGVATLESYGLPSREIAGLALPEARRLLHETIPANVIAWFDRLPVSHRRGDYLFVHAGIRPGIPLDRQEDGDLLWIRDDFLSYSKPLEAMVVHGHSVSDVVDLRGNRIGVDTGAYRTGRLSAVRLYGDEQAVITVEGETEMLLDNPL